jgi:hypothetical protein
VHEPEHRGHRQHDPDQHEQMRQVPLVEVRADDRELLGLVGLALGVDDHSHEDEQRRGDHAEAGHRLPEVVGVGEREHRILLLKDPDIRDYPTL